MATPPGFNGSYLNTWEYVFFPERFEVQENIRRGINPQNQRVPEIARTYINMPTMLVKPSDTKREA
jgi:hypothetical protein